MGGCQSGLSAILPDTSLKRNANDRPKAFMR